jgi:repressor LexA
MKNIADISVYNTYEYIVEYKAKNNGNSPSIRDIKAAVGISSTSVVELHLKELEEQGLIRRGPGASRSIVVIGGKWELTGYYE